MFHSVCGFQWEEETNWPFEHPEKKWCLSSSLGQTNCDIVEVAPKQHHPGCGQGKIRFQNVVAAGTGKLWQGSKDFSGQCHEAEEEEEEITEDAEHKHQQYGMAESESQRSEFPYIKSDSQGKSPRLDVSPIASLIQRMLCVC